VESGAPHIVGGGPLYDVVIRMFQMFCVIIVIL